MIRAMWASASGMRAQQNNIDVIANNLANVNTVGFKRSQVNFQDLLYDIQKPAGIETSNGKIPVGLQFGLGTRMVSTAKIFSPGRQVQTGTQTDVLINGDGFFQITLSDGSTTGYTRDGSFHVTDAGGLAMADGSLLVGIESGIDPAAGDIIIGKDGTVSQAQPDGTITNLATLQLAKFINPAGLKAIGSNQFIPTDASGAATLSTPGQDSTGELIQGSLELSNVEVVSEMVNLISAQRAYEVNTQAIRASDEMLQSANNLRR